MTDNETEFYIIFSLTLGFDLHITLINMYIQFQVITYTNTFC